MPSKDVTGCVRASTKNGRWVLFAVLVAVHASSATAAPPITVSPGGVERVERSASECPTFSWGAAAPVEAWDLIVYRLVAEATAAAEAVWEPALSKRLPGPVTSWTPSLGECLGADETYAWFVGTPDGAWSQGRLFEVVERQALDLERAIAAARQRLGEDAARALRAELGTADRPAERDAPRTSAPPPLPARTVSSVGLPGFGVDTQGIAWGNGFVLRCGEGAAENYFPDVDDDGFGGDAHVAVACVQPTDYITQGGDCNDNSDLIHPAVPEVCGDGVDNDCDGASWDVGQSCNTGQNGVCAVGLTSCEGGGLVCEQQLQPSQEVCADGLDNDCSGVIDDNLGGGACNTGQSGVCAAGITACTPNGLECLQQVQPSAEICGDNDDNDCNGMTDEGC